MSQCQGRQGQQAQQVQQVQQGSKGQQAHQDLEGVKGLRAIKAHQAQLEVKDRLQGTFSEGCLPKGPTPLKGVAAAAVKAQALALERWLLNQ